MYEGQLLIRIAHLKSVNIVRYSIHIVLLLHLNIISFTVLYSEYHDQKKLLLENYSILMQSNVEASLDIFKKFSTYVYHQISHDAQIMALFKEALEYPGPVRDTNRKKIYQRLKPSYDLLKEHHFRQLHFYFANGDSFLRVQKPEKYGDYLFTVRDSVSLANTQQLFKGFEEGKMFNGYRFIYPLHYKQQHIGSLEASLSMGSILDLLFERYPEDDFYFVSDSSTVDAKLLEDIKGNYIPALLSENYYFDKAVFEQNLSKINHKNFLSNIDVLGTALSPYIERKQTFSEVIKVSDTNYILSFISFKNFKGQHTGYLITCSQDKSIEGLNHTFIMYALLVLLVSLIYSWNIYSEHAYKKELVYLSNTDFLTKLFNRNKFIEDLTYEFVKYRESREVFSIVLFDIDHFKRINDGMGHNVGDSYLKEISELIASKVRHTDTLARWGGEEFIVLLPNTPENNAFQVAEMLRDLVESHQFSSSGRITISLGITEVNSSDKSVDDVIARADKALYKSKDCGRNTSTIWSVDSN
ncbi:diguanylate cyclase [Vibrio neptunius]|uniref:diguanylate cyclase n=2 Tax=Vibrio neptunius TaxID=170651 RepID=A0ABS3A1Y3_9VIBR|nr:diguanylate cyclase [Vibrio neptunius]MBN3516291.1 diguanylate cyclase [Vibrio neptunius]MBN3550236.1 diguanylate cyclase [Vibrio neptunius]MBN3578500.1 diguanylate cyclase [Vibrio neptunius]MCH9872165.1 diguanylate cyclase [Vibrio neptunius]